MSVTLREAGESALIALVREMLTPNASVVLGIGDDGAVIRPGASLGLRSPDVIAVADAMIEGVHFERRWAPARAVGEKLVNVNVSDVAAMGGRPEWALLTCSFPGELPLDWARGFLEGAAEACRVHGLSIVGGDMTGSRGPIALSLTVCGSAAGRVLTRSGARSGDDVYVTGPLGGAGLGLRALMSGAPDPATVPDSVRRQLTPEARVGLGQLLAGSPQVGACMDLSDGLAMDAVRLAAASGLAIEVELDTLPLSDELRALAPEAALRLALHGGEDYELLFTCAGEPPIPAQRIGRALPGAGITLLWRGAPWVQASGDDSHGFDHFQT